MSRPAVALRSAWMFPADGPPAPGLLTLAEGRVTAVGSNQSGRPPLDLGDVALLPGLVNSHTHLEFSGLKRPLGRPAAALPDWIREVVAQRGASSSDADAWTEQRAAAIGEGCRQSAAAGVAAVGDVVTPPWVGDWTRIGDEPPLLGVAFRELIALDEARVAELAAAAENHLRGAAPWSGGVSPHAPYSTHPRLVDAACRVSLANRAPLAMHVAESPEELQLLRAGDGPFRALLEDFGVWAGDVFARPRRPLDVLRQLADAHHALVIHGNYLDAEERQWLAERRRRMTVVYCPRTHDFFGHLRYPLADLVSRGVRVALGTDSLASNPDLQVWREFQFAARRHADVAPEALLRMVTLDAAEALGLPAGRLAVGARHLACVPLGGGRDPYERLVTGGDATAISPQETALPHQQDS